MISPRLDRSLAAWVAGAAVAAFAMGFVAANVTSSLPVALAAGIATVVCWGLVETVTQGPTWPLHPRLVLFAPPVLAALGYVFAGGHLSGTYLALSSAELFSFAAGGIVAAISLAPRPAIIDPERTRSWAKRLAALAFLAALVTFGQIGVPLFHQNVEQARALSGTTGVGYARVIAYLSVPAALLAFMFERRRLPIARSVLLALVVIVALADRSPFVYLVLPLALLGLMRLSGLRRRLAVVTSVVAVLALVVGFGTLRVVRSPVYRNYSEYAAPLATHDYGQIAKFQLKHYAETVGSNMLLAKVLVDTHQMHRQWGASYLLPVLTALPGKQLTLDLQIKQASQKTYVGGGTPPTLVGESYINFGWVGVFAIPALVGWAIIRQARRVVHSGGATRSFELLVLCFLVSYAVLAQVSGLVGASTLPPIMLGTLLAVRRASRARL